MSTKPPILLPEDATQLDFKCKAYICGTKEACVLKQKAGFGYYALLDEMIYYMHVTCRPDIGYTITTVQILSNIVYTILFILFEIYC